MNSKHDWTNTVGSIEVGGKGKRCRFKQYNKDTSTHPQYRTHTTFKADI